MDCETVGESGKELVSELDVAQSVPLHDSALFLALVDFVMLDANVCVVTELLSCNEVVVT